MTPKPTLDQTKKVAAAGLALRELRRKLLTENDWSLRDLYRTLDEPGQSSLRTAHEQLDKAVRAAYGMKTKADPLDFLLRLNEEMADREASMKSVIGPGLPPTVAETGDFTTADCIWANAANS